VRCLQLHLDFATRDQAAAPSRPFERSATPDSDALKRDEVKMMVQVNGKLRGEILIQADADHDTIRAQALSHAALSKHLEGAGRMIVVPNRLVNFIV